MDFSYRTIELRPRHVFRTARSTCASTESVIVDISDGRIAGIGEAAPSRYYGEDAGTVVAYLERMRPVVERVGHESELMAELASRGGRDDPAARAALEIAAHDMMGKRYGVPLYRHFDLDAADAPVTTVSIGLDEPEIMIEKALEVRGFPMLKIKLGRETDLSVVARIKEETGAAVTVDANCGWEPDEAVRRIAELARIGVLLVEQPVAAGDVEAMASVRRRSEVPIYADESCPTSAELREFSGAIDGVVVKLMKCGGLVEATRMIRMARDRGVGTMLGCMMESSIGITAAAHLAPMVDYADLDSGFLLESDPYSGMRIERGRMLLPEGAGLGVAPAGSGDAGG